MLKNSGITWGMRSNVAKYNIMEGHGHVTFTLSTIIIDFDTLPCNQIR